MSAPGKYAEWLEADNLTLMAAWARNGLTYEQIAHNMGIATATLNEWRKRFPAIAEALKRAREIVDIEVENALHRRAMGYDYTEEIYEKRVNKETGGTEMQLVKTISKHMPPDTTAQIFWLKNRRPELWRDRRDLALAEDKETGVALLAPVIEEGGETIEVGSE